MSTMFFVRFDLCKTIFLVFDIENSSFVPLPEQVAAFFS